MDNNLKAMCGLECEKCSYREPNNCPGCVAAQGKMYWGECPVAVCCRDKELAHCAHCTKFPCKSLESFAYDATHGDAEGSRILNLKKRLKEGK